MILIWADPFWWNRPLFIADTISLSIGLVSAILLPRCNIMCLCAMHQQALGARSGFRPTRDLRQLDRGWTVSHRQTGEGADSTMGVGCGLDFSLTCTSGFSSY